MISREGAKTLRGPKTPDERSATEAQTLLNYPQAALGRPFGEVGSSLVLILPSLDHLFRRLRWKDLFRRNVLPRQGLALEEIGQDLHELGTK